MKLLEETLVAQPPPLVAAEGGAVLRVRGTRVPLDTIVNAYLDGATPEEIALAYATLRLSDIYAVLSYYLDNREEVEAYLAKRRVAATTAQQQNEARLRQAGLQERLTTLLSR